MVVSGLVFASPASNALPANGRVVEGQATISQSGNVMTVTQASQRAVIDWDSFNIGKNATVIFKQPNTSAAILNRATRARQTLIYGNVHANGQVVFLNPNTHP